METIQAVQRYALGTILTLRMPGHSRTNGAEYYAPAIVLSQHPVTPTGGGGEIEVIIFDSTSGTSYQHAYAIRDNDRSNVGEILFDPALQERLTNDWGMVAGILPNVQADVIDLRSRIAALEAAVTAPAIPKAKSER